MSPPRRIGQYVVERRLGSTGPTVAFKCHLADAPDAVVVIKRLQPHLATPPVVAAFLGAGRAAAWLDHPHIAQLIETEVDERGVPFIAMQFVDGPTVAQIILCAAETGELPLTRLIAMFVGPAQALDYAHHTRGGDGERLDIVHGDVSTDNLRVGLDGVTKVLDFGQCRLGPGTKSKVRVTAPELHREPSVAPAPAADVFSLGVCLYLAATGAWPFNGDDDEGIKAAMVGGRFRKPTELIPAFPSRLEEIICSALELDPQRRPAAGALAEQLKAWLATTGEQVTDQELGAWIRTSFPERYEEVPGLAGLDGVSSAAIELGPAGPEHDAPEELFPFELPRTPRQDPFTSADFTAVDVNVSGLTGGPSPVPFHLDAAGGDYTSADVPLGDLSDGSTGAYTSADVSLGDLSAGDAPGEPTGQPRGGRARRALFVGLGLVVLLAGLAASAATYRARKWAPRPPSAARLHIDMAQKGILTNNPSLTRDMIDRARALPHLTPSEFIELATLDDATRFAQLLTDAEAALEAGDLALARAKLDQVDRSLPYSPEGRALRERLAGSVEPMPPATVAEPDAGPGEPEQAAPVEPAPPATPATNPAPRPRPAPALLSVTSEPAGATVFVDGQRVGTAPLSAAKLKPGKHQLALTLAGFARHEEQLLAEGRALVRAVTLAPLVAVVPVATPRWAKLEVTASVPAGISVDGEPKGTTPLDLELSPGRHTLLASADEHAPVTREVDLKEGEVRAVALELTPLVVAVAPPPAARREPSPDGPITQCPEETVLMGDAPPAGLALWCAFPSGVRSGRFVRWYPNARKAEEGEYVNGKKNGLWIEYFENGSERDRKTWRRGVRAW